jgi:BCD family chlorophyll transporter-like MFS transporter
MAAPMQTPPLFAMAIVLIGLGGGLFGHGTLTATMQFAPRHQVGLALGAWGAVQATAAGLAVGLGGVIRDVAGAILAPGQAASATGYLVVYGLEVALLLATLATMAPLLRRPIATA